MSSLSPHADAEHPSGGEASGPPGTTPGIRAGLRAAHANRFPGLLLSCFAIALLLSYWYVPAAQHALQRVADLKQSTGLLFPIVSTALFGGTLPWLVQRLSPTRKAAATRAALAFMSLFWALKGIEVDLLYRLLAKYVGDNTRPLTILTKMVIDMLIYCPIWAVPSTVLAFQWQRDGFSVRHTFSRLRHIGLRRWYSREVLPILISNLCVWVPAVAVIYQLPQPLQLPVQNLVLCFWTLMLIFMTGGQIVSRQSSVVSPGRHVGDQTTALPSLTTDD